MLYNNDYQPKFFFSEYCPQCKAVSRFEKYALNVHFSEQYKIIHSKDKAWCKIIANKCVCCDYLTFDHEKNEKESYSITTTRVYPQEFPADIPQPNMDMPDAVRDLYNEAALIFNSSPRSAAILLRLCLQYLLRSCGFKGTIYKMLEQAKKEKNIDIDIQTIMDACRKLGNKSAHEANQLTDDIKNMKLMFKALNIISSAILTYKREKGELASKLSEAANLPE